MRIYFPIAKVDGEQREVWGYASTEARDDQGEIVTREALTAALGDYMKFANIREMHQLSAVGVAKEAAVDDKGLYVGAKIVDDQAWQKVVQGVYKGYSIGGRVTDRDPTDYKVITGLILNEISLVDRPANPEAVFDYWKAAGDPRGPGASFEAPLAIWTCGVREHRHSSKSEATKCQQAIAASGVRLIAATQGEFGNLAHSLAKGENGGADRASHEELLYADPGYQADGKKRYPVDTEKHIRAAWNFINRPRNARRYTSSQLAEIKSRIVSAWKAKIDRAGPPLAGEAQPELGRPKDLALTKALWDVGHFARIILELKWLEEALAAEAIGEADDSPQPLRLQVIIAELCAFLTALVAEETQEILDDPEINSVTAEARAAEIVLMAAGASGGALLAQLCRDGGPRTRKMASALFAKARHSEGDQSLLDLAYNAVDKCMAMNGLLFAEKNHMAAARDALLAAGATAGDGTADTTLDQAPLTLRVPASDPVARRGMLGSSMRATSHPAAEVLEAVAAALGKKGTGQQALMDIAHDCIGKLTDGMCCTAAKTGARHSQETIGHLAKAHDHLVLAGAKCDAEGLGTDTEGEPVESSPKAGVSGDVTKTLAEERAEKTVLIATLADILPKLDYLTKRVEDIARTPLPPLTLAKNLSSISKQQDARANVLSSDELADAFARMSKEEQTLTLIKASYGRPIQPPGLVLPKDKRAD
jgi:hypothetical protein